MLETAKRYLASGLCVLPAMRTGQAKRVALSSWKDYQSRLPTPDELAWWLGGSREHNAICVVCGRVSGNLEMLDFDLEAEAFEPWADAVRATPGGGELLERLVIERSPSGGRHVVYRCAEPVAGNLKIAQRRIDCENDEPIVIGDKEFVPRRDALGFGVVLTLIETRGEGGLFLCDPSPGYELTQGRLERVPTISADERDTLLSAAWSLNEVHAAPVSEPAGGPSRTASPQATPARANPTPSVAITPGSDYNARGDVRDVLVRAGWRSTGRETSGGEHFTRPGKTSGTSATLRTMDGVPVFYVFSSNAPPFDPGNGYAPFAVYAMLEHAGDYSAAASALRRAGFGDQAAGGPGMPQAASVGVNLSRLMSSLGVGSASPQSPRPLAGTTPPTTHSPSVLAPASAGVVNPLEPRPVYVGDLVDAHPRLRPPVIHGLLREGETMNIIAAPKTGKSWLTLDLALSVATGSPWLDRYATVPGEVLIIDNELHPETSASRIPKVAKARNIAMHEIGRSVAIDNLRGRLRSIFDLAPYFAAIEPGRFKVIVLDAFYRFMPIGGDENDNGTMSSIYNYIDAFADALGCCFVLIHHSTKGSQSAKSITDVGAGAGAQSRAADTHLVLRQHEEDGVVVLDAAVRSWSPIDAACLRWTFPVWNYEPDLDPTQLKGESKGRRGRSPDAAGSSATGDPRMSNDWTSERFVREFIRRPMSIDEIRAATADESTLSWRKVSRLIKGAEAVGLLFRHVSGREHRVTYSTQPPAEGER